MLTLQYVQYGDEAAVKLMLRQHSSGREDVSSQMCHPLCTCDQCSELQARSSQKAAAVTPLVRDDMGRTGKRGLCRACVVIYNIWSFLILI